MTALDRLTLAFMQIPMSELVSNGAQVRAFLEQAYRLSRDEKIQDGIDLILGQIDEWLLAARFDLCEGALAQVDMSRLQADMVFSFVTSTLAAKHLLPKYRPRCLSEARKRLTQLRGEAFANQLLARYE